MKKIEKFPVKEISIRRFAEFDITSSCRNIAILMLTLWLTAFVIFEPTVASLALRMKLAQSLTYFRLPHTLFANQR